MVYLTYPNPIIIKATNSPGHPAPFSKDTGKEVRKRIKVPIVAVLMQFLLIFSKTC